MSTTIRQQLKADANHMIHFELPPEMSDEVEVIIFSSKSLKQQENLDMAQVMDETGFAKNILNSPEEDCWNDL
ncbi:MAG: hypothetical protein KGZ88_21665 [Methylomicrobium sp.]|nr:hypothetical protein [Methylomicrobium sp.]